MPPGKEILTLLPADIGHDCFAGKKDVGFIVKNILNGEFYGPPERLLSILNVSLKPLLLDKKVAEKDKLDFQTFIDSTGDYSKNPHEYYNKEWEFDRDDCILLIRKVTEGILITPLYDSQIKTGGFVITKEMLIHNPILSNFNTYKIIDLTCNTLYGDNTPESIAAFKSRGSYGGKKFSVRRRRRNPSA